MKYTFKTMTDENFPTHDSFMEAWNDMFQWVQNRLKDGGISLQVLETSIWIDSTTDTIYFYDARDKAIDLGWKYVKA